MTEFDLNVGYYFRGNKWFYVVLRDCLIDMFQKMWKSDG